VASWADADHAPLAGQQHRAYIGLGQRDSDKGVLPPFSEPVVGLTGTFLGMSRLRHVPSPARAAALVATPDTLMDIVHRPGDRLAFGEVDPPVGKARTGRTIGNLDSGATWHVFDGPQSVPPAADELARTARLHRVGDVLAGRNRGVPLSTDAEAPVAERVAGAVVARSTSWRDAFGKFPREVDGSVSVPNFVSTLRSLSAVSSDRRLSDAELARIASLVDPAGTGTVNFATFASTFSSVVADRPERVSLAVDGTGADRTHTSATYIHPPTRRAAAPPPPPPTTTASTLRAAAVAATPRTPAATPRGPPPSVDGDARSEAGGDDGAAVVGADRTLRVVPPTPTLALTALAGSRTGGSGFGGSGSGGASPEAALTPRAVTADAAGTARSASVPARTTAEAHSFRRGKVATAAPVATAAAPVTDTDRAVMSLSRSVLQRVTQMFGSQPSSLRKLFLRVPRTRDGSASVADVATTLADAGVPGVTVDTVASLLGTPAAASATAPLVSYDAFARAIATATLTGRAMPGPPPSVAPDVLPTSTALAVLNAGKADQSASTGMIAVMTDPLAAPARGLSVAAMGGPPLPTLPSDLAAAGGSGGERRDPEAVLAADALARVRAALDTSAATPTATFLRVDKQRDGFLTHEEVRSGLRSLAVGLSDADLDRVVGVMDADGSGAINRHRFVATLFPPDIHPRTKAYPFERNLAKVMTRQVSEQMAKWSLTPSYDMVRSAADMDAAPLAAPASPPAAGKLSSAAAVAAAAAAASGEGGDGGESHEDGPTWLALPNVDAHGMYQTSRDAVTEGISTSSRRHFNLDRAAPHLHGTLQVRDAYGTPAPFLVPPQLATMMEATSSARGRRASLGSLDAATATALERTAWTGRHTAMAAATSSTQSAEAIQAGKRANAILRRVMDKLSCRTRDAREVWLKLNNNHDNSCDVRELREGLAKCVLGWFAAYLPHTICLHKHLPPPPGVDD